MDIDANIQNVGGCGIFQIFLFTAIYGTKIMAAWITMMMAFGNYNPGWVCSNHSLTSPYFKYQNMTLLHNTSNSGGPGNETSVDECELFNSCSHVEFDKESNTLVTEWGLLCNKEWIPSIIISVQMAGGLLGSSTAGPLSDTFGRKIGTYSFMVPLIIANGIAIFSVSWEMFAVLRFVMGIGIGGLFTVTDVYPLEFVVSKWRTALIAIPDWNLGTATFALVAWLLRDWRQIHIATTVLGVVFFLPVFWVPESLRWLALHGRVEEAKKVAARICKMNKHPPPDDSFLETIHRQGEEDSYNNVKYTYFSLFRKTLRTRTLVVGVVWLVLSMVFYAITFGIKSLSGDFHLNLLLFSLAPIPLAFIVPIISHKFGRKPSIFLWISLTTTCCFAVVAVFFLVDDSSKGMVITVLALLAAVGLDATWTVAPVFVVEQFPTGVRTLANAFAITCVRVGAIIAPYLIPSSFDVLYISYLIMAVCLLCCCGMILLVSETNGLPLADGVISVEMKTEKETDEEPKGDFRESLLEEEVCKEGKSMVV